MSWRRFWQRTNRDKDLTQEIESYLAHEADLQAMRGLSAEDAAWAARRKLGNGTTVKEKVWEMNSLTFAETIWQDLRYAARTMRQNPAFFAVAILSLALGIGANTAIFQLLDAVRLRSLPVAHPEQLADIHIADNDHCCSGSFSSRWSNLTSAQWEQIQSNQRAFSSIFAFSDTRFNLNESGEVKPAEGLWVTGDYFKTLGVKPLLGRLIEISDDTKACAAPNAVISYPFWQKYFGGESSVLGKTLPLDGHKVQVMGVTPASFFGVEVGRSFDVILPACAQATFAGEDAHAKHKDHWWLAAMGRLNPGWTLASANAQLRTISPAIFDTTVPENYLADAAKFYREYKLTAKAAGTGLSSLRDNYESPLFLLMGIAALRSLDRLRESGQFDAGQSQYPGTRDGCPPGHRRRARTVDSPIAFREPPLNGVRISSGRGARRTTVPLHGHVPDHRKRSDLCRFDTRLAIALLHSRGGDRNLFTVWPNAGVASNARQPLPAP